MTTLINGDAKVNTLINGATKKGALDPANSTVNKGLYDATLLETVDPDLAVGNIKSAINIFGKVGTLPAGGVETIEKYADAAIADSATYTPAASGIFYLSSEDAFAGTGDFTHSYYSTVAAEWYSPKTITKVQSTTAIGDGSNFRIVNNSGNNREYILFRHYYSSGTYERNKDEQLLDAAGYTPAVSGFFADGARAVSCDIRLNFTGVGWRQVGEINASNYPGTIVIGDGTNLKVYNASAGAVRHVLMRAKLT